MTRRAGAALVELGRRFEMRRMTPPSAGKLLRDVDHRLVEDENEVHRQLTAAVLRPGRTSRGGESTAETSAQRLERLDAAARQLELLAGALGNAGSPAGQADLSRRLRTMSNLLDRVDAGPSSRQHIDAATRDAQAGRLAATADSLRDAAADLRRIERMLGDEQGLAGARRDLERSAEQIASLGPMGGGSSRHTETSAPTVRQAASGSSPPVPGPDAGTPPPPGPNQGSLPGRGTGGALGQTTPRLRGTPHLEHLEGIPGVGAAMVHEIVGPAARGSSRLPAARVPAALPHELDRAMEHDLLPPAYVTIIRRYFENVGGAP